MNFLEKHFLNCNYRIYKDEDVILDRISWEEVEEFLKENNDDNFKIGIVLDENIIILDVDYEEYGQKIYNILKSKNIKFYCLQTNKGYHFYFKTPKDRDIGHCLSSKWNTCINIDKCDWLPGKYDQQGWVYKKNKWREWLIPPSSSKIDLNELDELPVWLWPCKKGKNENFMNIEVGNRENNLWMWRSHLQKQKLSVSQIREIIYVINSFLLNNPLNDSEIENQVLSNLREGKNKEVKEWWDHKTFLHTTFIEYFLKTTSVISVNNLKYCYNGKYYEWDDDWLDKEFYKIDNNLTDSNRKEAIKTLKVYPLNDQDEWLITDRNELSCLRVINNGILNCKTCEIMPHSPKYFLTNMIEVDFKGIDYVDEELNKKMNEWLVDGERFGHKQDKENRLLFEEWWGTVVCSNLTNWKRALCIFWGTEADNGKSTFASVLLNFFEPNKDSRISTLRLENFSASRNKHDFVSLKDKMLVYNDECPSKSLDDDCMETVKEICSEQCNLWTRPAHDPKEIQFLFTGKILVTGNTPIFTSRKTNDWYNRLIMIPFWNQFLDKNADRTLLVRLQTESAKSYLLALALQGFKRLTENNDWTFSLCSKNALWEYKCMNNSVLRWVDLKNYNRFYFVDKKCQNMYTDYCTWFNINYPNEKHIQYNNFKISIQQQFNLAFNQKDNENFEIFTDNIKIEKIL